MKKFRGVDIDAGDFIRSLGRLNEVRAQARTLGGGEIGRPLPQNAVRVLWTSSEEPGIDFPSILLGSEDVLASTLPKMLALPGMVTPVTSLMKAWIVKDWALSNGEKRLSKAAALGFVGLIVGEIFATVGSSADLRLMGMDSVRRTLSFVCAQAVIKGWRYEALATIVERWLEASALTANEVDVSAMVPIADVTGFLQALSDLHDFEDASPHALAQQVQSWVDAQSGISQRDMLQRSLPQFARDLAGLGREGRYDAIMLEYLKSPNRMIHPLERGLLISLIEPGSFDFLDLARRTDPGGVAVAAAYCACTAILGKEATLSRFSGFGWNVVNNGLQADTEQPMDVSIAELRILNNARRDAPIAFRTRSPTLIDVELAPMVSGSFGNIARRKASSQRSDERSEAAEREGVLLERLETALRALDDAYGVLQGRRPRQDRKTSVRRLNK